LVSISPCDLLKLIETCGVGKQEDIIDVGGGASVLVDFLLDAGFTRLAVLDISVVALAYAKERLGALGRAMSNGSRPMSPGLPRLIVSTSGMTVLFSIF
jgi:hypothetical protein